MIIATTAPSGNVGSHVVHDLVRSGVRPRVLGHRAESLDPALRDHVDLHVVDLADDAATRDALAGAEALFVTVPSVLSEDPLAAYERFGVSIAGAVTRAGVGRVVLQSSVGAELRDGAGEIDGLAKVEELLDGTGASVVHLRCGFFFSNLAMQLEDLRAGEVTVLLPTDQPMAWVAPADVAQVAASWLLRADWSGRQVRAVHGPEDLSWDEALEVVSEATGHAVRARQVSEEEMRTTLAGVGIGSKQIDAIVGMSTWQLTAFVPEQPRDVTTTTETTLAAWAYSVLRPLLRS